jgi:hypothetical protein
MKGIRRTRHARGRFAILYDRPINYGSVIPAYVFHFHLLLHPVVNDATGGWSSAKTQTIR